MSATELESSEGFTIATDWENIYSAKLVISFVEKSEIHSPVRFATAALILKEGKR